MAYICHDWVHSVYDGIYICHDLKSLVLPYFLRILSKRIYSLTKPNYIKVPPRWQGFCTWHIYMPFVHGNVKNVKTQQNQFILNWMANQLLLEHFCFILCLFQMTYMYAIRTQVCKNFKIWLNQLESIVIQ